MRKAVGWLLGPMSVVLTLTLCCFVIFMLLNIVIQCMRKLPLTDAAYHQVLKDLKRKEDVAISHPGSVREIWNIVKLQVSICLSVSAEVLWNTANKIYLFFFTIAFFMLSSELHELDTYLRSTEFRSRPQCRPSSDSIISEKQIVFIRHAESMWNFCFNRPIFSLWFPFRFLYACGMELLLTAERDSVLLDSPLSAFGHSQCEATLTWLEHEALALSPSLTRHETNGSDVNSRTPSESGRQGHRDAIRSNVIRALCHQSEKRVVVITSNLRRAISTAVIALHDRWDRSAAACQVLQLPIYIHSCLQEATRNADGYSLTASDFGSSQMARPIPVFEKEPLRLANRSIDIPSHYTSTLDLVYDTGSKRLVSASLYRRLRQFANWVFDSTTPAMEADLIVAIGHSVWFKQFFTLFLPPNCKADVTTKKLPNCSIVYFEMIKYRTAEGQIDHWIDPESLLEIFKGSS